MKRIVGNVLEPKAPFEARARHRDSLILNEDWVVQATSIASPFHPSRSPTVTLERWGRLDGLGKTH